MSAGSSRTTCSATACCQSSHRLASPFITETVFSIPGIGSLLINAVKGRDIPVVMGTLIFIAIFVGIVNLIVDVIYALIDPRVKLTA